MINSIDYKFPTQKSNNINHQIYIDQIDYFPLEMIDLGHSDDLSVYNDFIPDGIDLLNIQHSLEKISNFYCLYKYWHMLVNDPKLYIEINNNYYHMFGKHIASFYYYGLSNKYIFSKEQTLIYHRFDLNGKINKLIFNDFNHKNEKNKIYLGIVKSLWQNSVDFWLDPFNDKNKLINMYKSYMDQSLLRIDFKKSYFASLLNVYRVKDGQLLNSKVVFKIKLFIKNNPNNINIVYLTQLLKMLDMLFVNNLNYKQIYSIYSAEIETAIIRLHFFLQVLVNIGLRYHYKFILIFELIIHELSLMIFFLNQANDNLFVSYDMLLNNTKKEFLFNNNLQHMQNIDVFLLPANSGMHAHTLSIMILQNLLDINSENIDNFSANIVGEMPHYFECNNIRSEIIKIKFNLNHSVENCQVHFINDSFINRQIYITPYDIDDYVKRLNYNHHNILILDRTSNLGHSLNLSYEINRLINANQLTIIIWESWQKFGLLGTDQAQYGRSVVIGSKLMLSKLTNLIPSIQNDMRNLDYQIAGLFQLTRANSIEYKNICYQNANKLRMILQIDTNHQGPFINNKELANVLKFFGHYLIIYRESFGFNYTTFVQNRISVGAEPEFDIVILGNVLKIIKDRTSDNCNESINNILSYTKEYFDKLVLDVTIFNNYQNIVSLFTHLFILRFILIYYKYKKELKISILNLIKIKQICSYILRMDKINYKKLLDMLDNSRNSIAIIVDIKNELKRLNGLF